MQDTVIRYSSKSDAIEQDIIPALGDFDDEYDADAIFEAAFAYRVDEDEHGNELLNSAGFVQVVGAAEFWEIVERCRKI